MSTKEKVILDLCGGTGSWSKPYEQAGYTVHLITLPAYDILKTTWDSSDIWFMPKCGQHVLIVPIADVYGILAAPPCTMFSFARTRAKLPRDTATAMEVVKRCLEIIWLCKSQGVLKWWALENPTGYLRQFLGIPLFSFRQWEYGGRFEKPTDIWGYFERPRKTHRNRHLFMSTAQQKSWTHPTIPESLSHLKITEARAAMRAITPIGFAKAFRKANP